MRTLLGSSFQLYDEQLTTETTLEDILSHRTGIPDYFLLLLAGYPYHLTREQLIRYVGYCNAVLYGAAKTTIQRLQTVMNAAARLVGGL